MVQRASKRWRSSAYASSDPRRARRQGAPLEKLLVVNASSAYCQPCVSTGFGIVPSRGLALQETGRRLPQTRRFGCARLIGCSRCSSRTTPDDWRVRRPRLAGGGWAFQFLEQSLSRP